MLMMDVLPLLRDWEIIVSDDMNHMLCKGDVSEISEMEDMLSLDVVSIWYDHLGLRFVLVAQKITSDTPNEIMTLLSDCKRHVSVGCSMDYVRIMHNARRIAQLAETRLSELFGRWNA